MTSNNIGSNFEEKVGAVLEGLRHKHLDRVRVRVQPRFDLLDGQCVIPDFELQVVMPFAEKWFLIECQHRKRSAPNIAQKIKYIKGLSDRNSFIFIYAENIPDATAAALAADGVIAVALDEFVAFIAKLEVTLRVTQSIANVKDEDIADVFKQ